MFSWFRKSAAGDPLPVAMSGVKLGDRLLIVGCSDRKLIAQLAAKPGLTGRACVVDDSAALAAAAGQAAERAGVLVETATAQGGRPPFADESFDVVVVRLPAPATDVREAGARFGEVRRLLRPGGRAVVIEGAGRRGLAAWVGGRAPLEGGGVVPRAMEDAGFRAVRTLAEREGLRFAEGVKTNPPPISHT